MLMSVDGKISTGDADACDVDKDFPKISGVAEGLAQYYRLEQETDFFSLNSGRVMAKIGANEYLPDVKSPLCTFIIIDNRPHLEASGVDYLLNRCKGLILATCNPDHPAFARQSDERLKIVFYKNAIDFVDLFSKLKSDCGVDRLTIQSGGTLNAQLLRLGLIDHISIVMAPALIGGKNTSSLIDGESLHSLDDIAKIKSLRLKECRQLEQSYVNLRYDVIN
ncbi:MAG: deaminase [Alphaproteobacteria bacterium]|nr:deaminase [Alphaproteobacteria bacterium]